MRLTALPAADRVAQAWRNGAGVTRQVAAYPEGAGFDFDWRVSLAEVCASGPFSTFAGVDRILAVLSGAMRLTVEGRAPVALDADSGPYGFAGDADCSAQLIAPVVDLNVMTRRGAFMATVSRLAVEGQTPVALTAAVTLLVVAKGQARLTLGDERHFLGRLDAARLDGGQGQVLVLDGGPAAVQLIGLNAAP